LIPLIRPDPLHAHLEKNVREHVNEVALQELLAKIERWTFERDMGPMLVRLNAMRNLPAERLGSEITSIIEEQIGRVYRLMRHVGGGFIEIQADQPLAQPVVQHIKAMIARDPADPGKLTPAAEECAVHCTLALMKDVGLRLAKGNLTMEDLWDVFSSGPGAGIVGDIMFAPFVGKPNR